MMKDCGDEPPPVSLPLLRSAHVWSWFVHYNYHNIQAWLERQDMASAQADIFHQLQRFWPDYRTKLG